MSSVGSLSTSTSTSIRGYGGLASGLDRDELIKGMTLGTTTKINKQEQKKQQAQWRQEAIQTISSSMIGFHSKYTETLTSPTNLFSSLLWGRNKITTSGINSKYVSVTGTASGADAITIMGIKQKAENAKWSSSNKVSSGTMDSGEIKIDTATDAYTVENLVGKTIDIKYGGSTYSIYLNDSDNYKYSTAEGIRDAINDLLSKQTTSNDKKLSTVVQATITEEGKLGFQDVGSGGNTLELVGGSALEMLGLREEKEGDEKEGKIVNEGKITSDAKQVSGKIEEANIIKKVDFYEYVAGKSLSFSYNGTSATVKMPSAADLEAAVNKKINGDETKKNNATIEAIADSIQAQLDESFGKDRIKVDGTGGKLSFRTTIPGTKGADGKLETDESSVFSLTGGSIALIGNKKGALQSADVGTNKKSALHAGDTTRLNLNKEVDMTGLTVDVNGTNKTGFKINGETIEVGANATMKEVMDAINKSGANITVSYQEAADKFTFTSKDNGASGEINFSDNSDETLLKLSEIFGIDLAKKDDSGNITRNDLSVRGQDAIVAVKYAGSEEPVVLRRDSNSFTVDGLTIAIKGTFGYEGDDLKVDDPDQAVEVDASVDVDKLMDTIKSFVEEYNSIVDMVNTQLTTKHEKDYDPLSSEQKSELSESEIEKWEEKAKAGLLFGDSDLRSLSMDLRVVVSGGLLEKFREVGISVSSTYSDNGKLSIDEAKLRGALQTDPEKVEKLFTSQAGVDADGNTTYNGLATNLKAVMNKYVNTTGAMESKGILIRKAGSKSSAMSLTQNTYYNEISSIDKIIEKLKAQLKKEQDRYVSQFSTLETLIANMNSQSSYLSSMSGY